MLVKKLWTDQRIEDIVGNLLRTGVSLSAFVVLCGAAIYLVRHGLSPANYRIFYGEPSDLRSLHGIVRGARGLHSRAIIQLGLLLLIATPVARVAFSIFGFAAERDRLYVLFTVVVLAVLAFSLLGLA
ncbi:MAG: DUF1634 domain-containing protein [Acidobacteriia bacterium]|nr:DUF1634 domain-containing protein [Terriglobia bacterium]